MNAHSAIAAEALNFGCGVESALVLSVELDCVHCDDFVAIDLAVSRVLCSFLNFSG